MLNPRLDKFFDEYGNALAAVYLRAQNGRPIGLEHMEKLVNMYLEFKREMLQE